MGSMLAIKNLALSMAVGTVFGSTIQTTAAPTPRLPMPHNMVVLEARMDLAHFNSTHSIDNGFGGQATPIAPANPNEITCPAPVAALKALKTAALDKWIEKLILAESEGDETLKILDHNDKYSYGCLQFQEETFLSFGRSYGLLPDDTEDVEPIIYSCALQKKIAKRMLQSDYDNWKHWYTSVQKIGLPPAMEDLAKK